MTKTRSKTGPLVLVVDDFSDAREMYGEYLRFCGYRVAEAQNGVEAIDQAISLKPAVILMDLSMPIVDGWEATRRLKADPATSSLVVVALSAHSLAAEGERARQAGCDGFIAKPCLPHDLVEQMLAYVTVQPADDQPRRQRSRRS